MNILDCSIFGSGGIFGGGYHISSEVPDEKIAEILKKRHYNPEQPDAKEMQKQYGYLMRRGYKSEDILRVMKCPDYLT